MLGGMGGRVREGHAGVRLTLRIGQSIEHRTPAELIR